MKTSGSLENIRKFRADVEQCMKCGFCGYFCPVYRESRMEKGLARGKNQLIKATLTGEQGLTRGFYEAIDNCLLCKTCVQYCPAKTRIDRAVTAARADYAADAGLPLAKSLVLRFVLPNRRLFGAALRFASWFQHVLPGSGGRFRHLPHFLAALGAGRTIPEIAPRFLRSLLPENNPAPGPARRRVAFFPGCAAEFVFPETAAMLVRTLNGLGCDVVLDRRQGCCGAAAYFSGDFETGRRLARKNVSALEGYDSIVTGCATCGAGLREYAVYLAGDAAEKRRLEAFASRVADFSEFVVMLLSENAGGLQLNPGFEGRKATWHDPCHLSRHQEIREQPRKILKAVAGLEFVEMPGADRCCGLGGSFSITHFEASKRIADLKAESIAASGANLVVTACPGCIIQLRDAISRRRMKVEVAHIGELFSVKGAARADNPG